MSAANGGVGGRSIREQSKRVSQPSSLAYRHSTPAIVWMDDHKRWTPAVEDDHLLMVRHRLASPARDTIATCSSARWNSIGSSSSAERTSASNSCSL